MQDPIFKGCTRPAMLMGVPLTPLVAVCGLCGIVTMWCLLYNGYLALAVLGLMIMLIMLMRQITQKDDQRLRQWQMRIQLRKAYRNRNYWSTISYSPITYKRR
ncbi:type IV secretion system protein VirB3 [Cupriavidus necator]